MTNTYIFNPDNDLALANGDANYLPPRSARQMATDLAFLATWWANNGDSILIPHSDVLYYWSKTSDKSLFSTDIKWITEKEEIPHQPLKPWGWNPSLVKQMSKRGLPSEYLPTEEDMHTLRTLSSRQMAVEVLREIRHQLSDNHPLIGTSALCTSEEEIAHEVTAHTSTILKAPWSSSGKGLRRGQGLYEPPLSGWCARTLAQQGAVVVEPMYDKVKDFAMEFYSSGDGLSLTFVGYSSFVTDANGAYEGNLLMSDEEVEADLSAYIPRETLHTTCAQLQHLLAKHIGADYQGYVGVDMMICLVHTEDAQERYALHPCVEINLRMNMGVVAHILYQRHVTHGHRGRYMVEYFSTTEELKQAHCQRTEAHPLSLSPDGRIDKGYFPLTPIGKETQYCAWMLVE